MKASAPAPACFDERGWTLLVAVQGGLPLQLQRARGPELNSAADAGEEVIATRTEVRSPGQQAP